MPIASEIELVGPGISLWRIYDPAVKADLFSTAVATANGTFLVDPVLLAPIAFAHLSADGDIAGIVVTNENHLRAAATFADQFDVPILVHPALMDGTALPRMQPIRDHGTFATGLTAIKIDGGPTGEIAIHSDAEGGTLIIGDALINFEPYGFALLPAKYCSNARVMRRSLPKLLEYTFQRMLFAHGTPILTAAQQRLEQLLLQR
ncbi:MAG: hypothetical protein ABR611_09640 [Chthoniobacterales bacterium]